jgi:hypothetical protein
LFRYIIRALCRISGYLSNKKGLLLACTRYKLQDRIDGIEVVNYDPIFVINSREIHLNCNFISGIEILSVSLPPNVPN